MSYMAWIAGQNLILAFDHSGWQQTGGRVTDAYVRSGRHGSISPIIKYQYTVATSPYSNDRIDFGRWSSSDDEVRDLVRGHPVNKVVVVNYDPDDPRRSSLFLEGSITASLFLLILFCLVAGFFLKALLRRLS